MADPQPAVAGAVIVAEWSTPLEVLREDGSGDLFLGGREILWEAMKAHYLPEKTQEERAGPRTAPPGGRRRIVMAERTMALSSEPFDTVKRP